MVVIIEMPEWLKRLPKNACVDASEFAEILGITVDAFRQRYRCGYVSMPKPDFNTKSGVERVRMYRAVSKPTLRWHAVTVRNYIRAINRGEAQ